MRSTHGIERSEIQELDLIHLTAKKHTAVVSVSPFVTLYNIGGHCTTASWDEPRAGARLSASHDATVQL